MANPVTRAERRLINAVNVPFFFRSFLYLIYTIYSFFIVPLDPPTPSYPNITWILTNVGLIFILILLSQANYPNHLSIKEINQRLLISILPPLLFLLGVKQRWNDLKILIKRDHYGPFLLLGVVIASIFGSILYLLVLFTIIGDQGVIALIYVLFFTIIIYLPIYISDYIVFSTAGDVQSSTEIKNWETVSVRAELRYFNLLPIFTVLRTKRIRFWVFFLMVIIYYSLVRNPEIRIPVI